MRIAVTAPTGNIGTRLVPRLLDAGAEVVLLARDPAKVETFSKRGARVERGVLEDADFVKRATAGADALFWLTPPDYSTSDLRAHQRKLGGIAAAAVKANAVSRVVNLSSVGAQQPSGAGPISGLHQVEKLLEESGASVAHLRAAFFMENFGMSLETIRTMGTIFMPTRPQTKLPMVATRDIAAVAAKWLLDSSWKGNRVVGVHGPADLTLAEAASIIAEGVGREVAYVGVAPEQARAGMEQSGMSPALVSEFLEMYDAFDTGRLEQAEPRTPETTTPTTLHEFAATVLKPALG